MYLYISYNQFEFVEDVGFETNSLLTLKNSRCGDFTPGLP